MSIHWCGTGLSAVPGLRRLIRDGHEVVVWNRTLDRAEAAVGDLTQRLREFSVEALSDEVGEGDVVVSMLPADHHAGLAEAALARGAHFVSSSYISPEVRSLDARARLKGLCVVGEVGLDPGIDHLLAHRLVAAYRASPDFAADNVLSFTSYCGGVPLEPNPFRYKFSWSPLGVLRALGAPSRSLRDFEERHAARPWDALERYTAPLPVPEAFEVYPNRDSLPFLEAYAFDPTWRVRDFVRGTLRLDGWAEAWRGLFAEVAALDGQPDAEARLKAIADELWRAHAYAPGEADRVVLCVSLRAEREGAAVWHRTEVLDARGDAEASAMARLVSHPVALAVEAAMARRLPAGVSAGPSEPAMVAEWLDRIAPLAQHRATIDHLA